MWRDFQQLSGGQQALAALSLSLAIHSTFESAWFLCDEVDAALDVMRASSLADFMLGSSKQFLVVSHKPEVSFVRARYWSEFASLHAGPHAVAPMQGTVAC
jgi:chromosome segregation ATPase